MNALGFLKQKVCYYRERSVIEDDLKEIKQKNLQTLNKLWLGTQRFMALDLAIHGQGQAYFFHQVLE
jgi:hypothetical protein